MFFLCIKSFGFLSLIWSKDNRIAESGDGILGHHFNKRLETFAPCNLQSLLLTDFKENRTLLLLLFKKSLPKVCEKRKLDATPEWNGKMRVENQKKTRV
jgi:hypothetical protein